MNLYEYIAEGEIQMFEVKDLSMIYDMNTDSKTYALKGIDLSLPDTGLVGIIGPSGSGKSTLMYCLSTLKKPTEGTIVYNGKNEERSLLMGVAPFHAPIRGTAASVCPDTCR